MPFSQSTDNAVLAISSFNNELVIGGSFFKAGNLNFNRIAKFNGSSWSGFSSGLPGTVFTLAAVVYRGQYSHLLTMTINL